MSDIDRWMTRDDAAQYLSTTTRTIDRMCQDGKLTPTYLAGTGKRFRLSALDALLTRAPTPRPARFGRAIAAE
jgi:excisionase family DNA binding protein